VSIKGLSTGACVRMMVWKKAKNSWWPELCHTIVNYCDLLKNYSSTTLTLSISLHHGIKSAESSWRISPSISSFVFSRLSSTREIRIITFFVFIETPVWNDVLVFFRKVLGFTYDSNGLRTSFLFEFDAVNIPTVMLSDGVFDKVCDADISVFGMLFH